MTKLLGDRPVISLNRWEKAQTLLADTDLSVHVIEQQLGFGGGCHMTAMFKKYVGTTLRAYRKQSRAGKNKGVTE